MHRTIDFDEKTSIYQVIKEKLNRYKMYWIGQFFKENKGITDEI